MKTLNRSFLRVPRQSSQSFFAPISQSSSVRTFATTMKRDSFRRYLDALAEQERAESRQLPCPFLFAFAGTIIVGWDDPPHRFRAFWGKYYVWSAHWRKAARDPRHAQIARSWPETRPR
jgi:hypothetical protein